MRVALIDPSLFTLPYDSALAGALERADQHVTLHGRALTALDGSPGAVMIEPSFYAATRSPMLARLPRPARLAVKGVDHVVCMHRLRRRLAERRPDVIHFQWLPLPGLDRMVLPGFRRVAPLVLTVHDTDPFNGSPTARLQSLGFTASLAAFDRLIVHTLQGMARLVALGVPARKLAHLPHGPLAAAPAGSAPDPMQGPLTFVLFGKIKPYKGADLLIEAFARLSPAQRMQARLRIVGQAYMDLGPLRARVAALGLEACVAIEPRFVADDEMPAIFAAGCVAMFPYREIEASGVLSLALAHGRPVIASCLGNFAEVITDRMQGLLVPPGDAGALGQAMAAMLDDRSAARRYAASARLSAQEQPGWDEIAQLTLGVYADAARQTGQRRRPAPAVAVQESHS